MYTFAPRLSKSKSLIVVLRWLKGFSSEKEEGRENGPIWVGPYIITAKFSKGFYSLQSVANSSDCIKRVNGAHLKMFYSS